MTTKDYKEISDSLPKQPGVYRFIDKEDTILYIGKAKHLKKRLASYFGDKKHRTNKTRTMVRNANRIEYTIVDTETDALLLESTLIKKYQPRYNVMLKDGKSYSYICIKKERFPRVFLTRRVIKDGSTYFGPYTSRNRTKDLLDLIKILFPLRTCTYNLSEDNIQKGKFKVCLEYHIKNCMGPCAEHEDIETYNNKITQIRNILKGNFAAVKAHFNKEMQDLAVNLEFEKAHILKDKLRAFEDYQSKSTVVSTTIRDVDVFSIVSNEKDAFVNYIKVVNGAMMNSYTLELVKNLDEDEEDLLAYTIPHLREKFNSIAPEIIVPYLIPIPEKDVSLTVPKIGDKRKLLDLSEKNVKYFLLQKQREAINKISKQTPAERILRTMQKDLQMTQVPLHIECFDNSNLGGDFPTASCVVFKNAKPSKKDYRHYNVKTVIGPDDFASMTEIVYRRYKRLLDEEQPLPQLIIIDGGKGQLSASVKSLEELGILDKVTVIGIAKKLEEIFFPNDSIPLYINKKSESLKLIQQARNEAHRFAITFHRVKRSQFFTETELKKIAGIGEKTADKLLIHFGSVKKVKAASEEELNEVVGKRIVKLLLAYFSEQEKEEGEKNGDLDV
ncbi:MAG: excinuclease ABC subunit C [Nonlabens sp.]|jgi:excinuclease ABC subunit C